jgi:ATP-dependent Lon protease
VNPDAVNPDVVNPDVVNPDVVNPDVVNPDVVNPDVVDPDAVDPDAVNPDAGPEALKKDGAGAAKDAKSPEGESSAPPESADDSLIILCVRNMVLFPGVVLPLSVGRTQSVAAVQEAVRLDKPIGLLLQHRPDTENPGPEDLYKAGTIASVLKYLPAPDGSRHIICQGQQRFRVVAFQQFQPFPIAKIERLEEEIVDSSTGPGEPATSTALSKELEARFLNLKEQAREALQLLPQPQPDLDAAITTIPSPAALADMIATYMDLSVEDKQELLETWNVGKRLEKVASRLAHRVEILRLSKEISQQTKGSMDKQQREYYLREQLKTIQKELGEEDGKSVEMKELAEAIEKAQMPAEVEKEARKELTRLERMPEAAAEYAMIRTYLDWLIELPWVVEAGEAIDIARARQILDEDHYGLEKVKKRILEFLAVRKLKPDGKSPIVCLVGPPGVGKTSLGHSIARALNRQFVRISLGGVHDEAEVRGHRRTYIGALPGNIVQGIRKAGALNPVFLLDELDKVSASFHGDPSSALLEVLDPEQNHAFRDNYLAVPFDLSKVMFLGTANVLDAIPGALRDRCEVIELPGYTEEEKLQIARRYLVKRRLEESGLTSEQCRITDGALSDIVRYYTREAGCRNLEREIGSICRHVATRIAEDVDGTAGKTEVKVDAADLHGILGARKFEGEIAMRTGIPGVATGMAWTPAGGDILFVEATRMQGKGNLILTGQLGDVMKESAQAAISLVKSRALQLDLDPGLFEKTDIHVHVPAGAIPKDGPSAGVTIYTALVSLFCGKVVRNDVAMTGEISLRGLVLPVGGIKEKVLAAHRAGIKTVLLPARNKKDLEDIPQSAREKLDFVWLGKVNEAVDTALVRKPATSRESRDTPAQPVRG